MTRAVILFFMCLGLAAGAQSYYVTNDFPVSVYLVNLAGDQPAVTPMTGNHYLNVALTADGYGVVKQSSLIPFGGPSQVWLNRSDIQPGTNHIIVTFTDDTGATNVSTIASFTGAGFAITGTNGPSVTFYAKHHLLDLTWATVTMPNPFYGTFNAGEQYWNLNLSPGVTVTFFRDSLPAYYTVVSTSMNPPLNQTLPAP